MYYFSLQSIPPLLATVQSVFNVGAGTAGLLISLTVFPGLIMALPAGFLINKYHFRTMGFLAMVCVALGSVIISISQGFLSAACGAVIMGLGSCFLTIGTASIIPHWFKRKELGFAMGIYSITFPLATIIAFLVSPLMQQSLGWQSPFYLSTVGSIVCGTFFLSIKNTGLIIEPQPQIRTKATFKEVMQNSATLKVGLIWLLYNMASAAFVTWTPTLLFTYKDLNLLNASSISSLYMVVTMFMIPVYGWVGDKYRKRKALIMLGLVGVACSVPALIYLNGLLLIPAVVIVGVFASAIPAQALALMAEAMPLEKSGIGFGMMSFWNRTATVVVAPLVGFLLDATQSMVQSFVCISVFAVLSATVTLTLRLKD
jgi:MFS family permease